MSTPRSGSGSNLMGMGMGGGGDGDAWDDAELIRAYDKSVKNWRRSQTGKDKLAMEATAGPGPWTEIKKSSADKQLAVKIAAKQRSLSPSMLEVGSWIVGAPCRALYTEDGQEYEAKILGIEGPQCTVRFVGYGNEELVPLIDLKTTHGKRSRDKQRKEAQVYSQIAGGGELDVDCQSNISLTSSMCNNYTDSVCRERDVEDTLTDSVLRAPLQASTPHNRGHISLSARQRNLQNPVPRPYKITQPDFNGQPEPVDNVDSALPSAAEATIDSSSELSSGTGAEGLPEVANGRATASEWENFNNTMPQVKFPVPPMPLSLSKNDGTVDFGRGELPALLMSWYMAGYQSGFFDAKREMPSCSNANRVPKSSPKRMN